MHAIGCILAILLGLFWFIASAVINIYRAAFGPSKPKDGNRSAYGSGYQSGNSGGSTRQGTTNTNTGQRRKIFEDNEGEYVDFVEVKD